MIHGVGLVLCGIPVPLDPIIATRGAPRRVPVTFIHTKAAAIRSRLRRVGATENHRFRLPVRGLRVAANCPRVSRSTSTAWMVPLWRLGSRPIRRTSSEPVIGPLRIRMLRAAMRVAVWKQRSIAVMIMVWCDCAGSPSRLI